MLSVGSAIMTLYFMSQANKIAEKSANQSNEIEELKKDNQTLHIALDSIKARLLNANLKKQKK